MEILYAPTFREQRDTIHANCQCGYDSQILETLCNLQNDLKETKIHKILYLPHEKTPKKYHTIILNALIPPPHSITIKTINSLKQAKNSVLLVTDAANIALSFSLFYQRPSIIHLPAFINIELGGDKLYSLFSFTTSLKELQAEIIQILKDPTPKEEKITNFLQEDLL